ncbi:MAG: phytanoyl-CoA dioxygenase family protein [Pseudomonadales bacterium]
MTTNLAVPLDQRVELASSDWIRAANSFLIEQRESIRRLTRPVSFSLAFDNAPSHLSSTGTLGYAVVLDGSDTMVNAEPDPNADFFQRCIYDHAIPTATIIHDQNEESATRRRSEHEHLFGESQGYYVDAFETDKDVSVLLLALHDHMARRTLNNPAIEHRANSLGLESHLRELDAVGYTVLPAAFSHTFADELRRETHRNHEGRPEGASFRATMLLQRGTIWEQAALHPWILALAEYMLGRGCLMYQSDTIVKETGQETHPGLHADYGASRIGEPFPEYCLEATAVWAIDDFRAEHGPTVIRPGSFKERRQVPPGTTQDDAQLIEMEKGSIAFWHGATWHGSTPRTAPGKRTSLHNAYSRNFIRTIERYEDIDPAIVTRNPPAFSTLCGLDDPFGKSGDDGADFERLKYCAAAGYGQAELLEQA